LSSINEHFQNAYLVSVVGNLTLQISEFQPTLEMLFGLGVNLRFEGEFGLNFSFWAKSDKFDIFQLLINNMHMIFFWNK
jgi:hypothetical protein